MRRLASWVAALVAVCLVVAASPLAAQKGQKSGGGGGTVTPLCLGDACSGGGGGGDTTYGVLVTPSNGNLGTLSTNQTGLTASFTVKNTGSASDVYSLTCPTVGPFTCTAIHSSGGFSITTVHLASGASTSLTVVYNTGSSAGSGWVFLVADDGHDLGYGQGGYSGTVQDPGTPVDPVVQTAGPYPGPDLVRGECFTAALAPAAAVECGDLRIVHTLPGVRTKNKLRTPTLLYSSASAHPYPVIGANVTLASGGAAPDSVIATLSINGIQRRRATWPGAQWRAGSVRYTRRIAIGYDAIGDSTGVYLYTLEIAFRYGGTLRADSLTGQVAVVNRAASPFGAGWSLAGVEQVVPAGGNLLWIGGDGSLKTYVAVAGHSGYWAAAPLEHPDTIVEVTGGKYERRMLGGTKVVFDATGRHLYTVNRLNDTTTFTYTSGRLTNLSLPPSGQGIAYGFAYTGSYLTSVTSPAPTTGTRTTAIVNTSGNLTKITDPDSTFVTFAYDAGDLHRMTSRTDRRGTAVTYGYDSGKKLYTATIAAGAGIANPYPTFAAQETQGIAATAGYGSVSVDTSQAYTVMTGPRTDVTAQEKFRLDVRGAVAEIYDPLGAHTVLARGDARWPGAVTLVTHPNGRKVSATYDERGLTTATTDSSDWRSRIVGDMGVTVYATTAYAYDSKFGFVTSITNPESDGITALYDSITGNRLSEAYRLSGSIYATYTYGANGLLQTQKPTLSNADSVFYDVLGNPNVVHSGSGAMTTMYKDRLGRDTLETSWIDTLGVQLQKARTTYNTAGRVIQTVAIGPALPNAPAETLTVKTFYDKEGDVDSLLRKASPDINGIGWVKTSFQYDAAGRKTQELAADGRAEQYAYDPAGNVVQTITRRGDTLTSSYDAANRLTRRVTPQRAYAQRQLDGYASPSRPNYNGTGYLIPADTATLTYDVMGNVLTANNGDARDTRVYTLNGAVVADTQRIRTYSGSDFTKHVYGIGYTYDLDGRRITLAHPGSIALGPSQQQQTYTYDQNGHPFYVVDPQGNNYILNYDINGRLYGWTLQGGVSEVQNFNAKGLPSWRSDDVGFPAWQFVGTDSGFKTYEVQFDSTWYDARAKMVQRHGLDGSNTYQYSGLGALVQSVAVDSTWNPTRNLTETIRVDALGNIQHDENTDSYNTESFSHSPQYQANTGRETGQTAATGDVNFTQQFDSAGNAASKDAFVLVWVPDSQWIGNDSSGQPIYTYTQRLQGVNSPSFSYYGADGKLRLAESYSDDDSTVETQGTTPRTFSEEYRYDALGRRVMKRSRGPSYCIPTRFCASAIERYVWDGNRPLFEIRRPGADSAGTATLEADTGQVAGDSRYYGRVFYVYGQEADPLGATRIGYSQDFADGYGPVQFGVMAYEFVRDTRGMPIAGVLPNGTRLRCVTYSEGGTQVRCVEPDYPARSPYLGKMKHYAYQTTLAPDNWFGDVVQQNEDAVGTTYMLNRYYDPATGKFTQEDPVGLAGGLNAYGFAKGDPINYDDPLGLRPRCCHWLRTAWNWVSAHLHSGSTAGSSGWTSSSSQDAADAPAAAAAAAGAAAEAGSATGGSGVSNPVPTLLARVVPADTRPLDYIGKPGEPDAFVTDATAVRGLSAAEIPGALKIPASSSGFKIIEFPTTSVGPIASPVFRDNPGFVGRGLTSGGLPEFVVPNQLIPEGATITEVPIELAMPEFFVW